MKTRLVVLAFAVAAALPLVAHPPVTVVVDARGNAYYSDLKQVWKVAPDGTKTVAVPNVHTHELYLDAHGNLFGEHLWYEGEQTDKWGHYVWRRGTDGKIVKVIPDRAGFLENYSFVRDTAGNMYFADRDRKRVQKRAANGTTTVVASNLKNIRWMTAAHDGTVHLIDRTDLVRITPQGAATVVARELARPSLFGLHIGPQHSVMGLWTDRARNVYAAVYEEDIVKRIAPDGKVTVAARSSGMWSPVGGAFAPNGDLLLLEWSTANQARLRRIPVARIAHARSGE
jgi:hypothetical protein